VAFGKESNMRFTILAATLALGLSFGCGASAEFKQLSRDQAASSAADLHDYRAGKLKPDDVDRKFYDDACSWAAVNHEVNGVPIPAEFAPVTSAGK
jgi:hypothetical protein